MRRRRTPDPEAAAAIADLLMAARVFAARAESGDRVAQNELAYLFASIDSIGTYGFDGIERIRARRWLRKTGLTGQRLSSLRR